LPNRPQLLTCTYSSHQALRLVSPDNNLAVGECILKCILIMRVSPGRAGCCPKYLWSSPKVKHFSWLTVCAEKTTQIIIQNKIVCPEGQLMESLMRKQRPYGTKPINSFVSRVCQEWLRSGECTSLRYVRSDGWKIISSEDISLEGQYIKLR